MKILITGGNRGLGGYIAHSCRLHAHHVKALSSADANLLTTEGVNKLADIIRLYRPNVFINNAFDRKNPINSGISQCQCLKVAMENMAYGKIVNINSIAAFNEGDAEYDVAKRTFMEYSQNKKMESKNIKIIDIFPGAIATGMAEGREDFNKLIDPIELSEFIVHCIEVRSFYVDKLIVRRSE